MQTFENLFLEKESYPCHPPHPISRHYPSTPFFSTVLLRSHSHCVYLDKFLHLHYFNSNIAQPQTVILIRDISASQQPAFSPTPLFALQAVSTLFTPHQLSSPQLPALQVDFWLRIGSLLDGKNWEG